MNYYQERRSYVNRKSSRKQKNRKFCKLLQNLLDAVFDKNNCKNYICSQNVYSGSSTYENFPESSNWLGSWNLLKFEADMMHTTQCSTCIMEVAFLISMKKKKKKKKKNIYIYISIRLLPNSAFFCHTCLMTLSQTNHI